MSNFKDYFGGVGDKYRDFRPSYPEELYDIIKKTAGNQTKLAVDVGCGNGQATVELAKFFDKVIGIDPSEGQIKNAIKRDNIEYLVSPAEEIKLPEKSIDMITVAQAVHWFNLPLFYDLTKKLLKKDGHLVIFGYGLMDITNNQEANKLHWKFYQTLGDEYWPPQRKYLDDKYVDIKPTYENTKRQDIFFDKTLTIGSLMGYYSTWSGYNQYLKVNPNSTLLKDHIDSILKSYNTTSMDTVVEVKFPLYLIISKNE
ncbi:putative SAM dependent methyltransferase [Tieghemostelium lacteum]|uniref:Putative SAM dependent methyltransferase n=1 Tax=Tieghemostelium lacteum TaxID=361077 RepID=A0A151Z9H3_TIELA|nr:putative SAM dependent methyltransferase [Tieghemostelium lacteum]|eukprot:KYQ90596.1 putative SAM dependent methyltransferase [Tieghemostelium lacteum]